MPCCRKAWQLFAPSARNLPVWFRPLWPRSECSEFSIDARKAVDAASGMIVAQTLTDQDADDPS